jgi:hypothetical protein
MFFSNENVNSLFNHSESLERGKEREGKKKQNQKMQSN